MTSVPVAKRIIQENTTPLEARQVPLFQAAGQTLAADIISTLDIPAFAQSSMDGYAFSFMAWQKDKTLTIEGKIAAGDKHSISIKPGQAARIFTGAAVPADADTVVMQEKVREKDGGLIIEDDTLQAGDNVRPKGSEIKAGAVALEAGRSLSAAAVGFLAGIGVTDVKVYPNPSISILITGNELQQPGQKLQPGQVFESNSFSLKAALQQMRIEDVNVFWISDNPVLLKQKLEEVLEKTDVVLFTGGISVGEYDFVLQAATECGVEKLFHRVKQRPGKPLYFGRKGNKLVFGLPGNPASVFTCFCEYVIPALEKMSHKKSSMRILKVPIGNSFAKNTGLTHFLKGFYDGNLVFPLEAQESFRMSSFARANCIIQIEEEKSEYKEGEFVEIHLLPWMIL